MMSGAAHDIEARLVLDGIFAQYGYDLRDYEPQSMRRRLDALLARSGAVHYGELLHRLLHQPEFFAAVLDDLMVQVSDMFRDPSMYLAFRRHVLPVLRTYPELRIWHAGCASGEEVYATAILLSEADLYERTQIYATDLSASVLSRASEGVYSQAQGRGFAENYRAAGGSREFGEYCSEGYGRMIMRDFLRKNVVFFQHSLVSDYALGEMHVIFCRNVLIYFNTRLRERVYGVFDAGLCPGGFLCLGQGEALPSQLTQFTPIDYAARIYRRGGQA
jgi:chemotaxis protein methyltransferase CheR